jgi:hypothetical protein
MKMFIKKTGVFLGAALAVGMMAAACGGDDKTTGGTDAGGGGGGGGGGGFMQPANTVALSFTIDDSANKTYGAGDGLKWKGSFTYDEATRKLTHDPGWGGGNGPYPPLYDDGPWDQGGHEPAGSTAGDNIWGVTVFLDVPTMDLNFEYGAENGAGWIWVGPNGTFMVPANSTSAVTATGLTVAAHGTIDMRLTIDTSTLAAGFDFDPTMHTMKVKGSYGSWQELDCLDDGTKGDETAGDGIYTFVLSENVGAGSSLKHSGLLKTGDVAQFVFVVRGVEYKGTVAGITGSVPLTQGVTAYTKASGGNWTEATIQRQDSGDQNTYVSP